MGELITAKPLLTTMAFLPTTAIYLQSKLNLQESEDIFKASSLPGSEWLLYKK
jgi:hypothetical protein